MAAKPITLWLALGLAGCASGARENGKAADSAGDTQADGDTGDTGETGDTDRETAETGCVASDEVCDGADNDCDGEVDEGVTVSWYSDADGDGYGVGDVQVGCEVPAGGAVSAGDCDDADASVHPDATEHCADGRDDDCDGATDETCTGCTTTVPGTWPTVQSAIDAAMDGDTVCVAAGTYVENLDFGGRNLTVLGVDGADATVLDGSADWELLLPTVTFQSGEDAEAVLDGFTVTGGTTMGQGGGIRILDSSPTLRNLVVTGNSAWDYAEAGGGGGIYARGGAPTLSGVRVEENYGESGTEDDYRGLGGGIMLDGADGLLENVTVSGNWAGAGGGLYLRDSDATFTHVRVSDNPCWQDGGCGIVVDGGAPSFTYLLVDGNYDGSYWRNPSGAGIRVSDGNPAFSHAVVRDNRTDGQGGALWLSGGTVTLSDTILAGNDGGDADEVLVTGGAVSASWTTVYSATSTAWVGEDDPTGSDGNLSADPIWYDTVGHLDAASPLIGAGDPADPNPDGSPGDPGIFGGSGADGWDLDRDGYASWWLPGPYDPATSPGLDCDDGDAAVYPGAGC
jgi:hypothetical protein